MANQTVVKVKVDKLTKFGYADAEGYVSYSQHLTDHDKSLVVPGAEFEAEIFTSPKGARYLNKIIANAAHVVAPKATATPAVDTERAKKYTPKFNADKKKDDSMSKEEWAAKDQRISRQGVIQVAVQVAANFDDAVELANKMLAFVNGVK